MNHQPDPHSESADDHAERMRLLNAAVVRLHGLSVEQLRVATVFLASLVARTPSNDAGPPSH
jgi:hypothetical protein